MEIRHLRSFVVLAREQHFGRAAASLHIAQPALSQHLKQLESEVGSRLVDRSTRHVELTDAGRMLLQRAQHILTSLEASAADLRLLADGMSGTVRIGFVGTATYDLLPRVARRVRGALPGLRLELHGELLAPELLDRVAGGELDVAVVRPGRAVPHGVETTFLRSEPLVVALPAHHPAAGDPVVALGTLSDEVFVTHPSGERSTMHERVLQACLAEGFVPQDIVEVGETGTLVAFVAAGLGVGLVPASVRALRLDGVVYRSLSGPPHEVSLHLAHRPDPPPAVRRLAREIESIAQHRTG